MFRCQFQSLAYRKYLNIIAIISIVALCIVLIKIIYTESLFCSTVYYQSMPNERTKTKVEPIKKPNKNSLRQELEKILNCRDMQLHQEKVQYGQYWLIKNLIRGRKSINIGCGESITYTTQSDYTFVENLPTVIERWLAPVSFAIYAPGYDYYAAMTSIQYARNCLPQSELIRDYVSFHIFFPKDHLPSSAAKTEEEALNWPYNCQLQYPPYVNVNRSALYKTLKNLTYPINVGRNIARKAANTYFIFACDVELYPSLDFVKHFLKMVIKNPTAILEGKNPKVFVLPVFEVRKNTTIPNSKKELQQMLNSSLAIPFHKFVCKYCHLVPKQEEWIKANDSQELEVIAISKRHNKFKSWEPFYISDNREPIFDERFTWEGQNSKRIQNYAMCLLDYEYHVLHPVFLIHKPGIKTFKEISEKSIYQIRLEYAIEMDKLIDATILLEYVILYGKNEQCTI